MQTFFIILLSLALIAIIFFAIKQFFAYKKEKSEWERTTEERVRQVKSDASEYIRETIDKISNTVQDYENKSDREILMSIVFALSTYGRRIDRIDDKLDGLYNYKAYIDSMNLQAQKLSEYYIVINDKINEIESIFGVCKNTLQSTSKEINTLNQHFSNTINLEKTLKECIDRLTDYSPQIYTLKQQVNQILKDMENVVSTCDSSPVTKLKNIEKATEKTIKLLDEIHSYLEEMDSEISTIESDVSAIKSDVSTIESAVDEYSYNSLYSKINDIGSSVSDLEYSISSLESNISDIKSSIA